MTRIPLVVLLAGCLAQKEERHTERLSLGQATAATDLGQGITVFVTSQAILVGSKPVVVLAEIAYEHGDISIPRLGDALKKEFSRREAQAVRGVPFERTLVVVPEPGTPYGLLTRVLYDSLQAPFESWRLVASWEQESRRVLDLIPPVLREPVASDLPVSIAPTPIITLMIDQDGYRLLSSSEAMESVVLARKGAPYPSAALRQALAAWKRKYELGDSIIIAANLNITCEVVADAMLAIREDSGRSLFPNGLLVRQASASGNGPPSTPARSVDPASLDTVKATVRDQLSPQVQDCYERRLQEIPMLAGRVQVSLRVANGAVYEAHIEENGTGDSALGACVVDRTHGLTFPPDLTVDLVVPFVLSAS